MEDRPLIILVALQYEAAVLARALGLRYEPSQKCALGSFCTFRSVRLHVIGPGAQALPPIEDDVCAFVLAGLAGALDPSLQNGNVLIDAEPKISDDHPIFASARAARLVTQKRIASTPADKARLFRATGAAAVDMESDAVRQLATSLNVPLIILRGISDRADEPLDPVIATFVSASGRTAPLAILLGLLRRPKLIPQLFRLQRNSRLAMDRLCDALITLLNSGALNSPQPAQQ